MGINSQAGRVCDNMWLGEYIINNIFVSARETDKEREREREQEQGGHRV